MNDEEIKRLLGNVEVKPSAHCWTAIEGNLAAVGAAGTAATATKVAGHVLSTAAKAIIGAAGTAAVATTAIILVLTGTFSPKETGVAEEQRIVTEVTRTDETITVKEEPVTYAQPSTTAEPVAVLSEASPSAASAGETPAEVTTGATVISEPAPQLAEKKTAPAPHPATQASASGTPAKASIAPATPKPTVATETPQSSTHTDLSDPTWEDAEPLSSIDFTPPVALVIPNIITPNGDGYNDVFIIQGIEQTDHNRLIIRNSNGAIVFQTVNYRNDWGAPNLADGTYFYQFAYTLHGIDETRTGTLTIMR